MTIFFLTGYLFCIFRTIFRIFADFWLWVAEVCVTPVLLVFFACNIRAKTTCLIWVAMATVDLENFLLFHYTGGMI